MSRRDVRQNRRAGAAVIAPVFPFDVAGVLALYDAGLGITTVSGKVSAWNDSSGTGDSNKNLVQATAGNRPTYNTTDASFNNLPTLSFSNADPDVLTPTGNWATSITQPITVYSVHSVASLAAQVTYYDDHAINNGFVLLQTNGAGFGAGAGSVVASGFDNTIGKQVVYAVVFNGASSVLYDTAKTAVASGNVGTNGSTGLQIGLAGGGASGLQGKFAYMVAYQGAHSAATVASRLTALGLKYAITIGS